MRLSKAQKEDLLSLIAEGLETDEINQRARRFRPTYEVSRQTVDYYRRSQIKQAKETRRRAFARAIERGFAIREKRIAALNKLADIHFRELTKEEKLWLDQKKSIGFGENAEIVDYKEYNEAEVKQFRGLLDDIAKEMCERKAQIEHANKDGEPLKIVIEYADVET